jgi:hypothetical protein
MLTFDEYMKKQYIYIYIYIVDYLQPNAQQITDSKL